VTWKVAEDGAGTVLRFLEVAGKENAIEVQAPLLAVRAAWMSDALERKQEALSVSAHAFRFEIKPYQIVTIRLEGTASLR
jgi:alpha-mannosidase